MTSCDVPLLVPGFVERMLELLGDHDIAVMEIDGFPHPLSAVYRRAVLPQVESLLAQDRLRPVFLFDAVRTRRVSARRDARGRSGPAHAAQSQYARGLRSGAARRAVAGRSGRASAGRRAAEAGPDVRYQPRWRWYSATSASRRSRLSDAAGSFGSGVLRKRSGSVSSAGVQPASRLNSRLAATMRRAVSRSSSPVTSQPVTAPQHLRRLGVEVVEHPAQELAEDQRVHQRGLVLGLDRVAHGVERDVPAIDLVREVHLVGAAAVVIGAARADGEPERHRLQRPRLVAGNLEPLDLRRDRDAVVADRRARRAGCPRPADRRAPRARRSARSRAAARRRCRTSATARRASRARRTPSRRRSCRRR